MSLHQLGRALVPVDAHWDDDEAAAASTRPAAVLALFTDVDDPAVVITERAASLRSHAGQLSFPGGRRDPGDANAADTALRETWEEVGLDPRRVQVLGRLPRVRGTVTSFDVTVVVGLWDGDGGLRPVDEAEVAQVVEVPVSVLADPARRWMARHPKGRVGPAFWLDDGLVVWGFTAGLVDELLRLGGWEREWDVTREQLVPERFRSTRG